MAGTVLVLGASGLFGGQAAKAFAAAGWTVRTYRRGTDMLAAAKGVDVIVNALNPPNYHAWDRIIPQITAEVIAAGLAVGATVLLVQSNFGCGSSREHAPQALLRWGFRVVVAESFSPIFAGNALAIGLVCVSVSPDVMQTLMAGCESVPETECRVDLEARTISVDHQDPWPISLPETQRHAWLSGEWDATGLLLANYAEVERVDARLPYLRTTARNA